MTTLEDCPLTDVWSTPVEIDRVMEIPTLLDEPEQAGLLRMTKLVEHVCRVPVAYLALLGPELKVVTRVGSGSEHWTCLQTYPLEAAVAQPTYWPDPALPAPSFISGDLRFAASVPLHSSDGLLLGLLVIADTRERPDFSKADRENLVELARMLAGKMELRMMASEAREAERANREAERRFRNIADSAPVMIVYSSVDGAVSYVNRTWLEFTGRKLEDELGDGFALTVHSDHRAALLDKYWDAFEQRTPLSLEFPMRRHDGVYRWMRIHGVPRFRDDGAYAGYTGCLVDITDQRSAIAAMQKQTLCTAAVADAAGAFYLVLDTDGRVEQVSPLCQRASRREPASMCGRFIWKVCDAAIPAGAAIRDAVRRAATRRETVHATTSCPLPGGKGAGELDWTFTPVLTDQNEVVAVVATTFGVCAGPGCACGRIEGPATERAL